MVVVLTIVIKFRKTLCKKHPVPSNGPPQRFTSLNASTVSMNSAVQGIPHDKPRDTTEETSRDIFVCSKDMTTNGISNGGFIEANDTSNDTHVKVPFLPKAANAELHEVSVESHDTPKDENIESRDIPREAFVESNNKPHGAFVETPNEPNDEYVDTRDIPDEVCVDLHDTHVEFKPTDVSRDRHITSDDTEDTEVRSYAIPQDPTIIHDITPDT